MSAACEFEFLSPCPFCGHVKVYLKHALREGYEESADDPDAYAWWVTCPGCAMTGSWSKSKTGAIKLWNTRHVPTSGAPSFYGEQLAFLQKLLTVPCCHVIGEHDPTHYRRKPGYLCHLQKAAAFDNVCKALGITPKARTQEESEKAGCYWCTPEERRNK